MREIDVSLISETVAKLCVRANKELPCDLIREIDKCAVTEKVPIAGSILGDMKENILAAHRLDIPVCQDTGMAVVFLEIGQDVHFTGGSLYEAVNAGVRDGYVNGKMRLSVVSDPLRRKNTGDNTPAVIHTEITDGEKVKITVAPKGFGSENMSRMKMMTPACGYDDIVDFVVNSVKEAGSNPCPPVVIGVGIGGDFEQCALLSKKALCRNVSVKNGDVLYASLEEDILKKINELGIGPQGFGGNTTALSVAVETAPTHIAGLPVAVNVGCHVTRHAEETI